MIARLFKSRLFVGVASAATALALIGGVAYANTLVQPSSSDKYYACFSNTDYLKGKIYLNMAPPTCPAVTDVVRSWDAVKGAVGATGPSGSNGVAGATGPSGATGSGGDSYRPINLCSSIPGPSMNFSGCNLVNGDFKYARLSNTWFPNADLSGANLCGAGMSNADLTGADLSDASGNSCDFVFGTFVFGTFVFGTTEAAIPQWRLLCGADRPDFLLPQESVNGSNCDFVFGTFVFGTFVWGTADAARPQWRWSLSNAKMRYVDLRNRNLTGADISGADLTGADLRDAPISGANLFNANLTDADLTGAIGTPSVLVGVIYNNTTCPDGTNSDAHNDRCFEFLF